MAEGEKRRWTLTRIISVVVGVIALTLLSMYVYRNFINKPTGHSEGTASNTSKATPEGGQGSGGGRRSQGPVPVKVVKAQNKELERTIDGLGTVLPMSTIIVRSRVEGVLERILFREGQTVKAGQLLAEIETAPFVIQVRQAEAVLYKDQASLENAKVDLVRYQTLVEADSGSKQQRDTQAALVRQLEGTVKIDRAALETARLQLGYTRITAPISGRVGLRQLDAGNLIKAGDGSALAVVTQVTPITVTFSIPQDRIGRVMAAMAKKEGLEVRAYERDRVKPLAIGTLTAVDNQVDINTGTVKLKARFENRDQILFPNQFINVALLVERLNGVVLPAAALQQGTPGTFVYVVKPDQTVSVRPIKTGLMQGDEVMVDQGLKAGERVVVEGVDKLREGAKVNVITASSREGDASEDKASGGRLKGKKGKKAGERDEEATERHSIKEGKKPEHEGESSTQTERAP